MKKASAYTLFILFAAFFLSGCRHNSALQSRLDEYDSMVWTDPSKAYELLQRLHDSVYSYADEGMRMRYELTKADAQNKAKQPMTSDAIMKKVAAYFNAHRQNPQQVRAHYLLGRIYADQGKLRKALLEYQQACDIADTTRTDCDWQQLALIHAQQVSLYMFQQMNDLAIEECERAKNFALKANNKSIYAQLVELQGSIFSFITAYDKSEKCFRKAYSILKTISRQDKPMTVKPKKARRNSPGLMIIVR